MVKLKINPDIKKRIDRCPEYYAIESIADKRLLYVCRNEDVAVIRDSDAIRCTVSELPKLAEICTVPSVRDEIKDIYEDLKYLKDLQVAL